MALTCYTLLIITVVNMLATTGDITLTWTSPVYPKLHLNDTIINPLKEPISDGEDVLIGSCLNFGAAIGPFPFAIAAYKWGRKVGLLLLAFPHIVSYFILAFSSHIYLFYLARFLGGLALGGGYAVLPMYLSEISKDENRGAVSMSLSVFWAMGNFIPYAVGSYMSFMWFNITLGCIPIVFVILFPMLCPESPYYLVQKGKIASAEKVLTMLRGNDRNCVEQEIKNIKGYLEIHRDGSLMDVVKDRYLRRVFIICIVLVTGQEFSGYCAITFHLQSIFHSAGINIHADLAAIIVGSSILITSIVSPLVVDVIGRKVLLVISCYGMFFSHVMICVYFYLQDSNNEIYKQMQFVPILSLVLYIFFFNIGICSVPWILVSELFPNDVKKITTSSASSCCWIVSIFTTVSFNSMNETVGRSGTFGLYAILCLACGCFVVATLPETKGKSFAEIQSLIRNNRASNIGSHYEFEEIEEHQTLM